MATQQKQLHGARRHANMSPYTANVGVRTSEPLGWLGLKLTAAIEPSVEVGFDAFDRHLINLTLTGTRRHLSRFGGVHSEVPTRPGEVLTIPKGMSGTFAFEADGAGERTLILEFDDALLAANCAGVAEGAGRGGGLTPAAHRPMPGVAHLLQLLARELEPDTARGRLFADSVIRALAIEIACAAWTQRPAPRAAGGLSSQQARRIADFIADRCTEELSLTELAAALDMPIHRFSRSFKRSFGRTPYAYVLDRRVDRAIALVEGTRLPLAQVAAQTGFADQQHMTGAVRRRLGRTPGSFRR